MYNNLYQIYPINEVYFGDKPLKKAQQLLSDFRKDMKRLDFSRASLRDITKNRNLLAFNREIEKVFGFETFSMHIDMTFGVKNAYTFPVSADITKIGKKCVVKSGTGFKFAEGSNICTIVFMSIELIIDKNLTDREVMAIFLHEIGHNFAHMISGRFAALNMVSLSLRYIELANNIIKNPKILPSLTAEQLDTVSIFKKLQIKVSEKMEDEGIDGVHYLSAYTYLCRYVTIILGIHAILNPLNIAKTVLYKLMANTINKGITSKNEVISDNFAAIYGYGADLSSALVEICYDNDNDKAELQNASPAVKSLTGFYVSISMIPMILLDPHPQVLDRLRSELMYLEKELAKEDLEPSMKKVIQKEIDQIDKILDDEFYNVSTSSASYNEKKTQMKIMDLFGGKSPSRVLADIMGAQTSNTYEDIEKRIGKIKLI